MKKKEGPWKGDESKATEAESPRGGSCNARACSIFKGFVRPQFFLSCPCALSPTWARWGCSRLITD